MKKNWIIQAVMAIALSLVMPIFASPVNAPFNGVETVEQDKGFYVEITATNFKARWDPNSASTEIDCPFNKGDRLKVSDQRNGWYEVDYGQEYVWIPSQYTKRSTKQTPDWVTVSSANDGGVRLRLGPGGKDSGRRAYFEDSFKYLGEQGNWYKVSHEGKVYWISKDVSYAE
ncbi:MAG: hypothetical protein IKX22_06875 [Prevotella sp.]|nr:hypothetical protein [Prevotella sp.]